MTGPVEENIEEDMIEDWEYEEVVNSLLGIEEEYDEIYAEEIERMFQKIEEGKD